MNRPRHKFHSLYLWHRYTGIICAVLVLILASTGLLLQHGQNLELQQKYLNTPWLLNWYGIGKEPVSSYQTQSSWVSQSGKFIYLGGQAVNGEYAELRGAVSTQFGYAIVTGNALSLLNKTGQLIETLDKNSGLPEHALGIAVTEKGVVIRGSQHYWLADKDFLDWEVYSGPHPSWAQSSQAPEEIVSQAQKHHRAHQIHWERVLLDLHSGRLFGRFGYWVMDIAAIGLIVLACSGLWVWTQRRRKDLLHRKK